MGKVGRRERRDSKSGENRGMADRRGVDFGLWVAPSFSERFSRIFYYLFWYSTVLGSRRILELTTGTPCRIRGRENNDESGKVSAEREWLVLQ